MYCLCFFEFIISDTSYMAYSLYDCPGFSVLDNTYRSCLNKQFMTYDLRLMTYAVAVSWSTVAILKEWCAFQSCSVIQCHMMVTWPIDGTVMSGDNLKHHKWKAYTLNNVVNHFLKSWQWSGHILVNSNYSLSKLNKTNLIVPQIHHL